MVEFELRATMLIQKVNEAEFKHGGPNDLLTRTQMALIRAHHLYRNTASYQRGFIGEQLFHHLSEAVIYATKMLHTVGNTVTVLDLHEPIMWRVKPHLLELHPDFFCRPILDCLSDMSIAIDQKNQKLLLESYQFLWVILLRSDIPDETLFTRILPETLKQIVDGTL